MILYGSFWSAAPGSPGELTVQGYVDAFSDRTTIRALWTTLWLSLVRVTLTLAIAIFFAWMVAHTNTPFRRWIEVLFWLQFFLPYQPIIMAWIMLLHPTQGLVNHALSKLPYIGTLNIFSYGGIIWVSTTFYTSIMFILIMPAFRRMSAALEESAIVSGASRLRAFTSITLPLMLPAILGAGLLGFIRSLESFETELFLGWRSGIFVYTTKIYELLYWAPAQYPPAMALSMVFVVIILLLVFLYWRVVGEKQYTTISGRAFSARPMDLGRWRYLTLILALVWLTISTFVPLAVLVFGSFMKLFGIFLPQPFTIQHWVDVLTDPLLFISLKNSLYIGISSALVGMLLYSVVSYIIVMTRLSGRRVLDFISWLPWSVPGLVMALGILWAYVGGIPLPFTLYGTVWIMIVAFLVKEMPMGVRVMNSTMVQLDKQLEESARVLGASWFHTFRSIVAPLLSPAFIATSILIFVLVFKDLVTVILLYTPRSRTISVLAFEYWFGGAQERAIVIGLIMSAIALGIALIARKLGAHQEIQEA
jgi:iron(III) transport system permease protein